MGLSAVEVRSKVVGAVSTTDFGGWSFFTGCGFGSDSILDSISGSGSREMGIATVEGNSGIGGSDIGAVGMTLRRIVRVGE